MSDESALLAAIRANPADRTARLVYADWLDDRGRHVDAARERVLAEPDEDAHRLAFAAACEAAGDVERAEFVRVQVELARLESQPCSVESGDWVGPLVSGGRETTAWPNSPPARCCMPLGRFGGGLCRKCASIQRLDDRERKLWAAGQAGVFLAESEPMRAVHLSAVREDLLVSAVGKPVRGLIGQVTGPAEAWVSQADEILHKHPVRKVRLTTEPEWGHQRGDGAGVVYWLEGEGEPHLFYAAEVEAARRHPDEQIISILLRLRWPGVEFELLRILGLDWTRERLLMGTWAPAGAGPPRMRENVEEEVRGEEYRRERERWRGWSDSGLLLAARTMNPISPAMMTELRRRGLVDRGGRPVR